MTNYRAIAVQAANQYHIPVQPFLRQLNTESHFQPGAVSPSGARWIGQFIPSTARAYGVHDDVSSIFGAAHYMADNLRQYGSLARALSAYNSGKPDAYLDPHFAGGQTYNYVRQILGGPQVPGSAPGNTAAAAPAVVPSPTAGAAAPPPSVNVGAILNAGARAVGLPTLSAKVFAMAPTAAGPTVQFARVHGSPPSPHEGHVVELAKQYLGTPYKWGGASPAGFDCSGFVSYLASKQGVSIGRTTYQQFKEGAPVGRGQLQPGDVVFFEPSAQGPGHEALYIGNGSVIAAPHTGSFVQIQSLSGLSKALGYVGARRII